MTYKPTTTTPGKRYDNYQGELFQNMDFEHWNKYVGYFNQRGKRLVVFSVSVTDPEVIGLINDVIERHTKK